MRQLHLLQAELFDELAGRGLSVADGQLIRKAGAMGIVLAGGELRPLERV